MEKYECITYNDNYFKILCIKTNHEKKEKNYCIEGVKTDEEEIERISLSRTKRNIKEICLCNEFEYFATFTINSQFADRFSLSACQDLLKKKLKKVKRTHKDFKYIFITEKHENGAFHFHGLIKGYNDFFVNEYGYLESPIFNAEIGHCSFSKIRDYNKCCNYITKYITKNCVKNCNNQIYISSRGLKKADREEIQPLDIDYLNNIYYDSKGFSHNTVFHNDFVKCVEYSPENLTKEQLIYLQNNLLSRNYKKNVDNF